MKDDKVKSDYEYSRDTYYELLEKGKDSLETMMQVARESEHPRAFEVLSNMIKNLSDVNDKLMDLNKKNKDMKKEPLTIDFLRFVNAFDVCFFWSNARRILFTK